MALSITRTVRTTLANGRVCRTEVRRVPLTAPREWGMFSAAGNRSITKKAERLLAKVEKLLNEGRATRRAVRAALVTFVGSWERMGDSKSYGEAGDTAVRECVGSFHDDVWAACFGHCGYEVWDETRDESYRRRQARAAKPSACAPATGQKAALLAFLAG